MPTRRVATLAGLALTTSLLGWQLVSNPAAADRPTVRTIRLEEHSDDDTGAMVDLGEPGVTVGDYFPILDALFRLGGREPIGRTTGNCMILDTHPETQTSVQECWFSFHLPDGTLTAQGAFDFGRTGPYQLAVTGGTETFRAAQGTLKVDAASEHGATFTFELVRPS